MLDVIVEPGDHRLLAPALMQRRDWDRPLLLSRRGYSSIIAREVQRALVGVAEAHQHAARQEKLAMRLPRSTGAPVPPKIKAALLPPVKTAAPEPVRAPKQAL